jgi:hypothetical protein
VFTFMHSAFVIITGFIIWVFTVSAKGPIWPNQWTATWNFVYTDNGKPIDMNNPWYYDATIQALRQDNNQKCNNVKKNVMCSAVFKHKNIYWYIPSMDICCLCWTGIPITEPDWLINSTYKGEDVYKWLNVRSTVWEFEADGTHLYYQSVDKQLPVCSSGWGTDLQWVNVRVGPFDQNVFNLPANCNSKCDNRFHCESNVAAASQNPKSAWEFLHLP